MHALLIVAGLVFAVIFAIYSLYTLTLSPTAHRSIPGPPLARFTSLYYLFSINTGRFQHQNIALHNECASSPIVRLAPNHYSISCPTSLKTIYGSGSKFPKSSWYDSWKDPAPDRATMFTQRHIATHAADRRKFAAMYSMSAMVGYESYVDECTEIFNRRLQEFAHSGQVIDMGHWFQCYAFDVIGDITYSERFGFLDAGEDVGGVIKALDANMIYAAKVGVYPMMHPFLVKVRGWLGGSTGTQYVTKFATEKIRGRKQEIDEGSRAEEAKNPGRQVVPVDFLDKFLDAQRQGKSGWKDFTVLSGTLSNILAGSDTTAASTSAVLYYLIRNPEALQKLREEIRDFEERGQCGNPRVSFKESQAMPYLQAVFKESLRLHPATGLPLWRIVPPGGAEICGHQFYGGEVVGVNTWVMHYNEDIWGPDARIFKPERWLENNEQKLKAMEAAYMPVSNAQDRTRIKLTENSSAWDRGHVLEGTFRC
jgi:cytochrome P450